MIWLLLAACESCNPVDDTAETAGETWAMVGDQLGDAMLLAGWAPDDTELLIVGGGLGPDGTGDLLRFDGTSLCVHDGLSDRTLWWIHGRGADDWVAVGAQGRVLQWDGTSYTTNDIDTTATLFGVWMYQDGTIRAVGGTVEDRTGEMWFWDGDTWTLERTHDNGLLFKVWDEWVVGEGVAWQVQGNSIQDADRTERLITVNGSGPDDVWAVGGYSGPEVLHWDGATWTPQDTLWLGQPLNGVTVGERVWVAGNFGVMGWWHENDGWQVPDFPLTSEHFHAVTEFQGTAWFLGGNYFAATDNYGTVGCFGCDVTVDSLATCD